MSEPRPRRVTEAELKKIEELDFRPRITLDRELVRRMISDLRDYRFGELVLIDTGKMLGAEIAELKAEVLRLRTAGGTE